MSENFAPVPPSENPQEETPKTQAFDPQLFPPRCRPPLQFILDHNPLLLLSTVLMLLGCYLVNSSIDLQAGLNHDHLKLLALLGVTNLYELCIIPLGLVLIRRTRGTARDGLWLILFEALFLVNGTFLNVDPSLFIGWWLNVMLMVLAIAKAGLVFHGLNLRLWSRSFVMLAVQLVIIYLLPIVFTAISIDGQVSQGKMYVLYWMVGLLPMGYDLAARAQVRVQDGLVQAVLRRTYLILPWILLVAHLGFSHWAHHSTFAYADVAPLLIGIAIASSRFTLPGAFRGMAVALPALAVLMSLNAPEGLWLMTPIIPTTHFISPAVLAAGAAVISYGYLYSLSAAVWAAVFVFGCSVVYFVQGWILAAMKLLMRVMGKILDAILAATPATPAEWGITAILASFLFLGVGAWISLRRTRPEARAFSPD
jgi:hypothetical protein